MIKSFRHKDLRKLFETGCTSGIMASHSKRLLAMRNPPHPGEFITEIYLEPNAISGRVLAQNLDVAPSTLNRLLRGTSRVTPEMALRLSKAVGRSAESWLAMQDAHDLWIARQRIDLQRVGKLNLAAA